MKQESIPAALLKTQLAAVLDAVSESGSPVLVTRAGKPIARLVPVDNENPLKRAVRFQQRPRR